MSSITDLKYASLPPSLAGVAQQFGVNVAVCLADNFSGRTCIPSLRNLEKHEHPFTEEFGLDLGLRLAEFLGCLPFYGVTADIPSFKYRTSYQDVYRLFMAGYSADAIAAELNVNRCTVFRRLRVLRDSGVLPEGDCYDLLTKKQKQSAVALLGGGYPVGEVARAVPAPLCAIRALKRNLRNKGYTL